MMTPTPSPTPASPISSSRKRKAPDSPSVSSNRPLVSITKEGLQELGSRIATVSQETVEGKGWGMLEGSGADHNGRRRKGRALDAVTLVAVTPYLTRFQERVLARTASMCAVEGAETQQEADELLAKIEELFNRSRQTISRLNAIRTRVAGLGISTCADTLRISKAAEDDTAALLERSEHGRSGRAQNAEDTGFSGLEAGVLEPKISMLIGAIAELPGPLKAVLQELPELTSSLSKTVQSVEAAVGIGESRTEVLLGKAPPVPRRGARGARTRGENHHLEQPPAVARATARETRVTEARARREAGGVGALSGIVNT